MGDLRQQKTRSGCAVRVLDSVFGQIVSFYACEQHQPAR
jgi:hypothetical protein